MSVGAIDQDPGALVHHCIRHHAAVQEEATDHGITLVELLRHALDAIGAGRVGIARHGIEVVDQCAGG